MLNRFALSVALMLLTASSQADIYKYTDENGVVNYTNLPNRMPAKAERIAVEPAPSAVVQPPASAAATAPAGKAKAGTATPPAFPRVDGDTQRKRDDARRQILQSELQAEQKALEDSRQALAAGQERQGGERNYQKYLDRMKQLQDSVDTHQANLDALQKEIGNLH
jgi:hypothetical protein